MKIKTSKGIKDVNEVFPNLESFKNHVLKLDKNIRYDNELIKKEMKRLINKLNEQEGIISLSLMRGWLIKNYEFKTKKYGKLEYWIERGWSEENALHELEMRNKETKQRNRLCEEYWINKGYTKEESINQISKQQQKSAKCIKIRHGKSKKMLSEKGYSDEEIKKICLTPANIEFWVKKGFSEQDAKVMVSKNQSNASNHVDFKKRLLPSHVQYWINKGHSLDESKQKVSKHQSTFTLEKCVEKYGDEEGRKRFTERQNKWNKSLSSNGNMKIGYSKISQDLFYVLLHEYEINDRDKIYFATHNKEFKLEKENGGLWIYDFTDTINKKIIEFNGDMFHANPIKYNSDDNPNPFKKNINAKEIWNKDKLKLNIAKKHGFEVLVIWDSEYRWGNKQEVINKCINFLKNK